VPDEVLVEQHKRDDFGGTGHDGQQQPDDRVAEVAAGGPADLAAAGGIPRGLPRQTAGMSRGADEERPLSASAAGDAAPRPYSSSGGGAVTR
jgi:hypothetical protein